ncbi:MAG TPA: NAD(P)H-hydrate epimerase [Anaerolineae bacterium]|nr:NAD(P)H-hydrate epimerase [Anaerolineae bacterium]HIP72111.1 NAD(P)H-hydrate epimerase [Anaerolineae bacterium]
MSNIPFLNTEQMHEVDRAMIEDYHIELIQMMENAGRNLAHLARNRFFNGDPREQPVVVLAGRGGNGGGGLVCARRLHNWGAEVQVFLTHRPEDYSGVPARQLDILQRMGVPVILTGEDVVLGDTAVLLIDAIIGYSLSGDPRGTAAALIQAANTHPAPILSLDAPSGLDTTTGTAHVPSIQATATMTLALPKEGLQGNEAVVGELYLADISVPPDLYAGPGLELAVGPIFSHEDVIRLW